MERISESSANEQNSLNDSHSVSEIKSVSSYEKLGVSNDNEILTYTHTYDLEPFNQAVKNILAQYETVSGGVRYSGGGSIDLHVYWAPLYPLEGTPVLIIVDCETPLGNTVKLSGAGVKNVQMTSRDNTAYFTYTIDNPTVSNDLDINPQGTSHISIEEFRVYYKASIELDIDKTAITKGQSVVLTPNVKATTSGNRVTVGTVKYYLNDGTYIGESSPTGTLRYVPETVGDVTFYAEYIPDVSDTSKLFQYCISNEVSTYVTAITDVTISVTSETYPKNAVATVTVTSPGSYTVMIDSDDSYSFAASENEITSSGGKLTKVIPVKQLDAHNGYSASISYAGGNGYSSASASTTFNIYKSTSSIDVDDQTITYGGTVDIDATIVNSTDVSGATLYKDGQPYTDVTPTISGDKITITNLPRGEYTLNATTAGDANHNSSWDTCKIIVNPAGSEVVVPSQSIVFDASAVLDITGENITGVSKVEIYKDGQKVEVTPTIRGTKVTISDLEVGEYTVKVTNDVDENHVQNTGEGTITVLAAESSVTVTGDEITYGETATVSVEFENATNGTYEIIKDGKVIKSGNITDNIDVSNLAYGEYTVRVNSTVDKNHKSSTGEGTIIVNKADPELTIDATDCDYPDKSTITVTSKVDGTYTVDINGTPVTVVVSEGKGTVTVQKVPEKYNATVSFDGNENYTDASAWDSFTVNRGDLKLDVTATPDNYVYGGKTFIKGTVETDDATGNVSYYDQNGRFLGNSTINDGIWVDALDVDTHTIKAVYSGDGNYSPSEDTCTVRVTPANSTVKVDDVEINHTQKVDVTAKTENATGITYVVLKGDETVADGTQTGTDNEFNIVIEGLEPGEYTLKVTTTVDKNHTSYTNESKITVKSVVALEITKVVEGETTVLVGDEITYTITVTNKGPSKATNVVVNDLLSGPASIVSEKCDVPEGSVLDGNVWTIDSIAADGHATLKLVVLTNGRGNVSNSVAVSCDENRTQKTNGTDNVTVVSVILNVNKTSDIDYIAHTRVDGDKYSFVNKINYTIVVSNVGLDSANNVSVVDVLPSYLSLVNAGFIPQSGVNVIVEKDIYNNVVRWNISNLDNKTKVVLWVQASLNTILPVGTNITNGVEAICKENSTKVSNESNNITIVPVKIEITKTANATVVGNNTLVNFTIVVKNKSLINITDLGIVDLLPKGFTYVNASSFSRYERGNTYNYAPTVSYGSGNTVIRWTEGGKGITELEKDGNVTVWVLAKSNGIGPQVNTVLSTCGENHTDSYNRPYYTGTCTVNITSVNLTVTKTADVNNISYSAYDGENVNKINYTIIVDNPSLINATDVIVEDRLPAGLTLVEAGFIPVSGVNVKVTKSGNNVKWNISDIVNKTQIQLWIQAQISEYTPLGNITNEVTVKCRENATFSSNKTNITVKPTNLTVVKKVIGDTKVAVGDDITYEITVTNNGPSIVSNVVITDKLTGPAKINATKSTVPEGSTFDGEKWIIDKIDAGKSYTLTVVAVPYLDGTVKNNVSVVCDENDTEKTNESVPVSVTPVVDLEITKSVDKTEVQVGQNITYTINVTNKGPSTATNVTVSEDISKLVNVVDWGSADYNNKTNVWNVGDLANNETKTLTLTVSVVSNGTVENRVLVKSNETDSNKTNNNATSENVAAEPVVDLEITKTIKDNVTSVLVGDNVTYIIEVTNKGPSTATDVKVSEELSKLVNLTKPVEGYDGKVWNVGTLAKNQTKTLTLTVTVISNGTISNNVNVTSKQKDTNESNNNASSPDIEADPLVILNITKTVKPTTANVGENVTYTITVKNIGLSNATGVKVNESLSDLVEAVGWGDADYDKENKVWTIGNLGVNETATLNLVVKVIKNGTVENIAFVNANENKTVKNSTSDNLTAIPVVDLEITKTVEGNVTSVLVGDNVTYTIKVTNKGPSTATDVKVSEELSNLVKLAKEVEGYDGKVWNVGTLAKNQTKTLTLTVTVVSNGTISNNVNVSAKQNDTNESNNNASSPDIDADPLVILNITKVADRESVNVGENITYTITVTNNGLSNATGVKVSEKLSPLVKVVDYGDADYNVTNNVWTIGNLAKNVTATLKLVVEVISNGTVENSASVISNENDTVENATSDNITAYPVVDLEITKTVDRTVANVGENITYTITVKNNGPSKATGVKVNESLSDLVKIIDFGDAKYDKSTNVWDVGDLDVNSTATLKLVIEIINNGTVENSVFVKSDENDTNMSNNNATSDNITVHPVVDLEISKSVDKTTANVGDTLTYTIVVKNNGPSKASDVKVTEVLSDLVELVEVVDGYDGKVWSVGEIEAGKNATLTLTVNNREQCFSFIQTKRY